MNYMQIEGGGIYENDCIYHGNEKFQGHTNVLLSINFRDKNYIIKERRN